MGKCISGLESGGGGLGSCDIFFLFFGFWILDFSNTGEKFMVVFFISISFTSRIFQYVLFIIYSYSLCFFSSPPQFQSYCVI